MRDLLKGVPRSTKTIAFALLAAVPFAIGCRKSAPADVARGDAIFHERCALCHGTGSGAAQGPGLGGVVGRKAASTAFAYSPALRASNLTWDQASLDRFLAAPAALVPGTLMQIGITDADDRHALVAYLATLGGGANATSIAHARSPGDYHSDAPGTHHHVAIADLPAPFATPSVRNAPAIVPRSTNASPSVPASFHVALYADALTNPRALRVAPNGDVFVSESSAGRVRVLRAHDGASRVEQNEIFAQGLDQPFGIAFYPPGSAPQWVYVANTNSVVRFAYAAGDLHARTAPETIVPKLIDGGGGHWTRDIAFSPDGAKMFVSVGSGSNVAETMPRDPPSTTWIASHALGATWGNEEHRADVLVFAPDGGHEATFATGIRNCVGLAINPKSGDLWCATNERDGLGDDLVPDYVTRVREGAFYGWPWRYLGDHVDPRHADERADLAGKVTVPDVPVQAHSAALELAFYDAAMFPPEFRGSAFVAFHGSWNRSARTGPKVVRVVVNDGVPTGEYEDFVTGFVVDDDHVWGRPVGVAVAHDGALLVSEDANGTVWRVSR